MTMTRWTRQTSCSKKSSNWSEQNDDYQATQTPGQLQQQNGGKDPQSLNETTKKAASEKSHAVAKPTGDRLSTNPSNKIASMREPQVHKGISGGLEKLFEMDVTHGFSVPFPKEHCAAPDTKCCGPITGISATVNTGWWGRERKIKFLMTQDLSATTTQDGPPRSINRRIDMFPFDVSFPVFISDISMLYPAGCLKIWSVRSTHICNILD